MIIEKLLSRLSPETFLERYFTLVPYVEPGTCSGECHLGTPGRLERILEREDVDAFAARDGEPCDGRLDARTARDLRRDGYSIVVRHAERHDPEVAALARSFATDFCGEVNVHMYWSGEGRGGFGWHYDAEDVFILQTEGSKRFRLRRNTVHPWPLVETLPRDMKLERERSPVGLECRLIAGDWLYIPAGYWHEAIPGDESFTLAVGVLPPTAMTVYDFLRPRLARSILWRRRLPALGSPTQRSRRETLEELRAVLDDLSTDIARELGSDELAADFLASYAPTPGEEPGREPANQS